MSRENYTCLIPFPKGRGHWAAPGETFDLLEVEAHALRTAGRIELTSVLAAAEAAGGAVAPAAAGKTTKIDKGLKAATQEA